MSNKKRGTFLLAFQIPQSFNVRIYFLLQSFGRQHHVKITIGIVEDIITCFWMRLKLITQPILNELESTEFTKVIDESCHIYSLKVKDSQKNVSFPSCQL